MDTHPYVKLAVQAIRHFLSERKHLICPSPVPGGMDRQSGAFVSIKKKKNLELRGCIGTVIPNQDNLANEIIHNAVGAATRDPRFNAVTSDELESLQFSVDVLTPLEPIDDAKQLNPQRYGLSVKYKGQQGILLPDLKGIDTVQKQIKICLKKGNIPKNAPYEMHRFEVERYF